LTRDAPTDIQSLPRVLNLPQATAIVVGTIIGSGIFLVPQEMMRATGSSLLVYGAWLAGGLLSLFGAMTYAELGAMIPEAGGEYAYLRGSYGDLAAFLYMWTWFAIAKPASIASVTMGLARVLAVFPALHWLERSAAGGIRWAQLFAIAATWLITGLNYLGMRRAGEFQLFFTWLKVLLIVGVAATCLFAPHGALAHLHTSFSGAQGGLAGFMVALIAALWAYDGWNDLSMVAGEIKHPERNLPVALIAGLLIVGGLYAATNLAIQFVLPAAAIAASPRPAVLAVAQVLGAPGAGLVSAVVALSIFVTLNGTIMSGARIPWAAARDRLFFASLGKVHPRFQSPAVSLVVQGWLGTALLLAVGRFQQLFELAIFAEWLFYMITASTIFFYRQRHPELPRPYRMWGYPVLPTLFIAAAALLLVYSYAANLRNSLAGTAVIALGVPVYAWMRRRYSAA
jgi:basic amino acid/polyamine antiporter, APA family